MSGSLSLDCQALRIGMGEVHGTQHLGWSSIMLSLARERIDRQGRSLLPSSFGFGGLGPDAM